jgi:hypothetical protein
MTASVITVAICYLVGSSLLLPRDSEPDLGFVVGLSLPLGAAIWSVTGFLALLTGLPVTPETLYATAIAAAALVLVLRRPALPPSGSLRRWPPVWRC